MKFFRILFCTFPSCCQPCLTCCKKPKDDREELVEPAQQVMLAEIQQRFKDTVRCGTLDEQRSQDTVKNNRRKP